MARLNFYLKNIKANRTSIILSITYDSKQCRYYTGLSIEPNKWNNKIKTTQTYLQVISIVTI